MNDRANTRSPTFAAPFPHGPDMHRSATFTGHRGPVYALAHGAAPGTFLSGSGDGQVVRWRIDQPGNGELLARVDQAVFSLCHLPEKGLLLIGTEGGRLHVLDTASLREARLFEAHRRGIFSMRALPGGRVVCAGGDGTLSVWRVPDAGGMDLERHIPLAEEKLRDLALDSGGERLAVACGDGTVRLLDTALFNEQATIRAHPTLMDGTPGGATAVAFHPAKPVLLSGGKDGHLRLWHAGEDHRALLALPAHKGGIYRIAFTADGGRIATASRDKMAKLWDATTLDPLARLDRTAGGHTHSVNDLLWLEGTLITASDDRGIIAWADA